MTRHISHCLTPKDKGRGRYRTKRVEDELALMVLICGSVMSSLKFKGSSWTHTDCTHTSTRMHQRHTNAQGQKCNFSLSLIVSFFVSHIHTCKHMHGAHTNTRTHTHTHTEEEVSHRGYGACFHSTWISGGLVNRALPPYRILFRRPLICPLWPWVFSGRKRTQEAFTLLKPFSIKRGSFFFGRGIIFRRNTVVHINGAANRKNRMAWVRLARKIGFSDLIDL